jgi:putative phosphoesterase
MLTKTSLKKGSNLTMSNNNYHFLEFDGRKIFISHFHDLVDSMAKSGDFDAVFYGHNHIKDERMIGDCIVVNPGEISASKTGKASYAIYNTEDNKVEFFEVKNSMTLKTDIVKGFYKERKTKN